MLTRPPLSSPPQTPAARAATRAAPTENGWLPLLPRSTLTRRGGCPHPPASFVPVPGSGQPGGHKGRPYRERLVAAAPRSMLTRMGGACPRPPLSSPPQTPAVRAATRAAPTENGWLPLLPRSTLTRRGGACPRPPLLFPPQASDRRLRGPLPLVSPPGFCYTQTNFSTLEAFLWDPPPVRRSAGLCRPAAPADAHARP